MYCSRVIKALWAGCAGGMVLGRVRSSSPSPCSQDLGKKRVIIEMTLPAAEIRSGYQARANTIVSSLCDYNWFGNEHVRSKNTQSFIPFLQNQEALGEYHQKVQPVHLSDRYSFIFTEEMENDQEEMCSSSRFANFTATFTSVYIRN